MKQDQKQKAIQSIRCYHSHLTDETINKMNDTELLAYTHPIDRERIKMEIKNNTKK